MTYISKTFTDHPHVSVVYIEMDVKYGTGHMQRRHRLLTIHGIRHIKSTQCIKETNTNLKINRYLPHTTDFNIINCMITSTN